MKKKYKLMIAIIVVIFIVIAAILLFSFVNNKDEKETVKVVDNISNFGYTLDDRDTDLMKNTYNELKEILLKDEIDYESYAQTLAKLFVIDLFTMNNKINRYDVGSTEYVYPESLDNFKTNVEDTIYKPIENNSDGKRKQDLPEVSSIELVSSDTNEYVIGEEAYDSFVISLNWNYEYDLGYDKQATITLIQLEKKLYVVEYVTGE